MRAHSPASLPCGSDAGDRPFPHGPDIRDTRPSQDTDHQGFGMHPVRSKASHLPTYGKTLRPSNYYTAGVVLGCTSLRARYDVSVRNCVGSAHNSLSIT